MSKNEADGPQATGLTACFPSGCPVGEAVATLEWLREQLPESPGVPENIVNLELAVPYDRVTRKGGMRVYALKLLGRKHPEALKTFGKQPSLAESERPPWIPRITQEQRHEIEGRLPAGEPVQIIPGGRFVRMRSAAELEKMDTPAWALVDARWPAETEVELMQPRPYLRSRWGPSARASGHRSSQSGSPRFHTPGGRALGGRMSEDNSTEGKSANPYEEVRERIRADALDRLRKSGSAENVDSILDQARTQAHVLRLLEPWPSPLTAAEKARLIHLIEEAKPLLEREFPLPQFAIVITDRITGEVSSPTFGQLCSKLLELLKVSTTIARGRPRDDEAIFAGRMLKWGAAKVAEKRLGSQLTPQALCAVALVAGVQDIPELRERECPEWEERIRLKWEKLHQRNLPDQKADTNAAD